MQTTLPRQNLVLVGIGHTNAHIVRMWCQRPITDTRLTCISNFGVATYSGMLPGVLAGQYESQTMQIDLVRLCAQVDAQLIVNQVTRLDLATGRIEFADRPSIPFDALSIGVGSVPARPLAVRADAVIPIKPMQTFLARIASAIETWRAADEKRLLRCVVVGAGIGGIEIACCLPAYLGWQHGLDHRDFSLRVITSDDQIGRGVAVRTQHLVRQAFARHGIEVTLGRRVVGAEPGSITLSDGQQLEADVVIWAAGARGADWLSELGLPLDDRGFIRTRPTLQSVADDRIFAVGDAGSIEGYNLPKAGVYAVRQGPVLWHNLQATLTAGQLQPYQPQRGFLKLINTGDGSAIAEYKGFAAAGRWAWKLKDRIDLPFIRMYQVDGTASGMLDANNSAPRSAEDEARLIRCTGCGSKIGGSVLSRALARLEIPVNPQVILGLDAADDAAIVRSDASGMLTATVDFFSAPLTDPYHVGRIAALNAASDLFAMGATPVAALALVTLPLGSESAQEETLYQLLSGCLYELRMMGATLVGGHTTEGATLSMGLSMLANQTAQPPRTKCGLRPGDELYLTKPLGSGVLLAAHMRAACHANWMSALLDVMLQSNQAAAAQCEAWGVRSLTDVTGFGLAGHLWEMLRASDCAADIQLSQLPLLPGVLELIQQGVASTLSPANRHVESDINVSHLDRARPEYDVLFDPQTSGGLLVPMPAALIASNPKIREQLSVCGWPKIGTVVPHDMGHQPRLQVRP
ncbi:MAG: selenide, water dikinase SelD [Planctomycetales bacterium]|nr:selenide, water dikinase SelD [Planctomycetales bacterium]